MQHEGGLAGAVGAEQRDPLATLDGEVDAEQRLVAVGVGEGQALRPRAPVSCAAPRRATAMQAAATGRLPAAAQSAAPAPGRTEHGRLPV